MSQATAASWHDFYLLLGGAAATLVGLTFVAASIAAGWAKPEQENALNVFITPTVVHFTMIVMACLIIVAPMTQATLRAGLLLALASAGGGYSLVVWVKMHRQGYAATVDLADRGWYALMPTLGYCVAAAGAALGSLGAAAGPGVIAAGFGLLLLAGIRNAWDMVMFVVLRRGSGPP